MYSFVSPFNPLLLSLSAFSAFEKFIFFCKFPTIQPIVLCIFGSTFSRFPKCPSAIHTVFSQEVHIFLVLVLIISSRSESLALNSFNIFSCIHSIQTQNKNAQKLLARWAFNWQEQRSTAALSPIRLRGKISRGRQTYPLFSTAPQDTFLTTHTKKSKCSNMHV